METTNIQQQLSSLLNTSVENITNVKIIETVVYFDFGQYMNAKLSKDGKKVLKNSVRLSSW